MRAASVLTVRTCKHFQDIAFSGMLLSQFRMNDVPDYDQPSWEIEVPKD
jgi:hypothetical protein